MIAKINGKVVDLTDVKQVMVHGGNNYEKAEKMLNSGMDIEEVSNYFCPNCGNYKLLSMECGCMKK